MSEQRETTLNRRGLAETKSAASRNVAHHAPILGKTTTREG